VFSLSMGEKNTRTLVRILGGSIPNQGEMEPILWSGDNQNLTGTGGGLVSGVSAILGA